MLSEDVAGSGPLRSGFCASKTKGWGPLTGGSFVAYQTKLTGPQNRDLTIGKVLVNFRNDKLVTVQPYKGVWQRVRVVHKPLNQSREGYTTAAGTGTAKETIRYEALVSQVEMLAGGELAYSSARRLSDRGWGLLLSDEDVIEHVLMMGREGEEMFLPLADGPHEVSFVSNVSTDLGFNLERLCVMSQGRLVNLEQSALKCLQSGERISFLEVFSGKGMLTLGVRAIGLKALDGWDSLYIMGGRKWDFATSEHQKDARALIKRLDPVI